MKRPRTVRPTAARRALRVESLEQRMLLAADMQPIVGEPIADRVSVAAPLVSGATEEEPFVGPLQEPYSVTTDPVSQSTTGTVDNTVWKRPKPVVMFPLAAEHNDTEWKRLLGWNIIDGWFNSSINRLLDDYAAEFRSRNLPFRMLLHSPWGLNVGESMDFDQRVEAEQNPHLQDAIDSFVPWLEQRVRPLVEESGGELIIYLGSGTADADMRALENNPIAYADRIAASIADIPDWASIALDNSAEIQESDPFWLFVESQQEAGRRLYVEARPHADSAVLGLPTITNSTFWRRTDPDLFEDSQWAGTNSQVANGDPSQVLLFTIGENQAERQADYQETIERGYTPLINYDDISWALDLHVSDDHADSLSNQNSIASIDATNNALSAVGVLGHGSDRDLLSLTIAYDEAQIELQVIPSDMDQPLLVDLYNDSGELVSSTSSTSSEYANLVSVLSAGQYFVSVQHADPTDLGQFNILGIIQRVDLLSDQQAAPHRLTEMNLIASNWGTTEATFNNGDFNQDGEVNLGDLVVLAAPQDHFSLAMLSALGEGWGQESTSLALGDIDGDGVTGLGDLNALTASAQINASR